MGDQRNGLKWVHSHISKFNGDNDNITLGGGSAGGRSVMNHMTHSESYDYFKNALTIGPAAIPYWKTSEVDEIFTRIYGHIRRVSNWTVGPYWSRDIKTYALFQTLSKYCQ